jgi:hypothetical protein
MPHIQTTSGSRLGPLLCAPTFWRFGPWHAPIVPFRHTSCANPLDMQITISTNSAGKCRPKASEPHGTQDWNEKCIASDCRDRSGAEKLNRLPR